DTHTRHRRRGIPRLVPVSNTLHRGHADATGAIRPDERPRGEIPNALSHRYPRHCVAGLARRHHDLSLRPGPSHRNAAHPRGSLSPPFAGALDTCAAEPHGGICGLPTGGLMALASLLILLQAVTAQAPAVGAAPAWTVRLSGDIRWQQVTPAGALLVSTDGALAGVDIERGQITWQKPELGGLPVDSVRMVEGSLLMEAAKPGLSMIFDPVTGTVLFDSRRLHMTRVVTRRVLTQTGTLIVHGRRASGPPVVALYDLATGEQRWVSESLFQ